jgi:hypothetical protein
VLDGDLVLTETLVLDSDSKLDCNGHTLSPSKLGEPAAPTLATAGNYKPSVPEVGIFLNNATGVEIRNCSIEGFDFGVVIVGNRLPADGHESRRQENRIRWNDISARVHGLLLIRSDANQITDNTVEWSSGGGSGVAIYQGSSRNRIAGNTLTSAGTPAQFVAPFPGFLTGSSRFLCADCGLNVIDAAAPVGAALINLRIGSTFLQFPSVLNEHADDNVVENNNLTLPGPTSSGKDHRGFIAGTRATRTIIRGNTVTGSSFGLASGGDASGTANLPGTCSLDTRRYCLTNADCFLPGLDAASLGSCSGPTTHPENLNSRDTLLEGNRVLPTFTGGGIVTGPSDAPVIRGNTIVGDGTALGIVLGGSALESATVTRNVISGTSYGLELTAGPLGMSVATKFGSKVSLNDITGSTIRAIQTIGPSASSSYAFPSQLSVSGEGNYWGHTCADGGFLPSDSPNPSLISDSHPYGQPVAELLDLPAACN